MKQQLRLLLVDFDGVMSNGRFYHSEDKAEQHIGSQVVQNIFTSENTEILDDWMRGKRSYQEMHDMVEQKTGLDARKLDTLLEASVKRMPLNQPLIRFITKLRSFGVQASLFTNNMDIFDIVSRAHHHLDTHFDHIYSSSEFGQLKLENDQLLKRALHDAQTTMSHTAFVDDSQSSYDAATKYGVHTFLYKDYAASQADFEQWLSRSFVW